MTTLATNRTAARAELQETSPGFWSNADIDGWINLIYAEIFQALRVEATATLSLTANVDNVTLPTDFYLARRVEIQTIAGSTNWAEIRPSSVDLRSPVDPVNPTLTGVPTGYYVYGNKIIFVPVPNAAYSATLYYYKNATALVADGDSIVYPEGVSTVKFDDAILLGVCGRALRKRQDGSYTTYAGDFNSALSALKSDALDRGVSTPLVVRDDWSNE